MQRQQLQPKDDDKKE
jgi:hypothetical protein